jgi:2-keto-4-pentenoate hydratase/2-oxohepta-3-ene-1,7-dioic acid hydratase in catechol pathway
MRYARYRVGEQTCWGVIEQDGRQGEHVARLTDAPWHAESRPTGERDKLDGLRLLAPAAPSKILAVGRNYADHANEMGSAVAEQPRIFFKPPTAIIGPGQPIDLPPASITAEVHYEAELAVIIGKQCRNIEPVDANSVIFGYTCANDVTARDIQRRDGLPDYAKSFDTFCPLGPWLQTELDLPSTRVRCLVNGDVKQDGRVTDMLTPVPALISYLARAMTLLPGDVILTGTPAGVGPLSAGNEVAIAITGIGMLINPVVGMS